MAEFEKEAVELSMEELEKIGGGYKKPAEKAGFFIYQIQKGDNLYRIGLKYGWKVDDLLKWNPKITDRALIYAGDYIYIKEKN